MATTYNDTQIAVVDGSGNVNVIYPITKASLVSLSATLYSNVEDCLAALGTAAFSNSYTDLDNKPSIPSLVGVQNTTGTVKNGSSVTSSSGYTASPIISGIPYYKDTTYSNGTGLSLSNGSFSVNYGTTGTTACAGNDSRLSNARTPLLPIDPSASAISGYANGTMWITTT